MKRNRTAWAQHWRHHDGPRPTLVVIHGFMADPYWVNSRFLALPWFYKQGYDILLYTLPHHGRRRAAAVDRGGDNLHLARNERCAHRIEDRLVGGIVADDGGLEELGELAERRLVDERVEGVEVLLDGGDQRAQRRLV